MTAVLRGARAIVSLLIMALAGLSFLPRAAAESLIPLQKLLSREIERRGGAA